MIEPRIIKGMGWKRDLPDARDQYFQLAAPLAVMPKYVNLSAGFQPVYDQGDLGSCTANAIGAAFAYDRTMLKEKPDFMPSRLFIYYNERVIGGGSTQEDSGASIRDGIKTTVAQGACDEKLWPYDIAKFTVKPPSSVYVEAAKHKVTQYARVQQDLMQIKSVLASGFPIVFGFSVYSSFMQQNTGLMPVPNLNTERLLGGHAVVCCGFNSHNLMMCRNSWSAKWKGGDPDFPGYFWMFPEVMLSPNLAADFWAINAISS